MSTRTILVQGEGWAIKQELADDSIWLEMDNPKMYLYWVRGNNQQLLVKLPQEVIDAIAKLKGVEMSDVIPNEFDGIGPDGKPAKFRMAEGRWYANVCPDCGETNGGGIDNEKHPAGSDPYSPSNVPCIWCGKGPMKIVFADGEGQ